MGKAIGGTIKGISGIDEAIQKRKDGKRFIAQAKAKQKAFEKADTSINSMANIKVASEGTRLAMEAIQQNAAQAYEVASSAGIKGQGMIGQINRNTSQALATEGARLADKQTQVDVMAAQQEESNLIREIAAKDKEQARIDQTLERGQALRSQGAAEFGTSAEALGESVDQFDQGLKDKVGSFISHMGGFDGLKAAFGGGASGPVNASGRPMETTVNAGIKKQGIVN